jgi:hypothetical protein
MRINVHLCPCCAAHLHVPAELHAMRCNSCDSQLVFVERGGVRGLALVPEVGREVPYSVPSQRKPHSKINGASLVAERRGEVLARARSMARYWHSVFMICVVSALIMPFVVAYASWDLLSGRSANPTTEMAWLLCGMLLFPILSYVALYFQGRASLAADKVRRWQ